MRKLTIVFCLFLSSWYAPSTLCAQSGLNQRISELSQQIASKMSAKQKTTIAVVEFTDLQGNVTNLGRFLSEELITRLYDTGKFKVIERQLLNKVIAEQKLSLTGVIEQSAAQRLGKVLGVDAIASGTIADLGKSLRVNARIIDTESGEIFAVASSEIVKDEAVMNLMNNGTSVPSVKSDSTSTSSSATKKSAMKVTEKESTVELDSCRMAGGVVTCQFSITNNSSEDRRVFLESGKCRIFDDLGGEYSVSESQLGNSRNRGFMPSQTTLVPGVATKAMLKFDKFNPAATAITVFRVAVRIATTGGFGSPDGQFNADFRDVALTK